jgi:two-component system nitrogen regulation response regulator GlnG
MKPAKRRILIVDPDSASTQEMLSIFTREGYGVEITADVRGAAETIRDIKFYCIIMDVDLPCIRGYDAVSIIKAIDPQVKIIMTTAENTLDLEGKVRQQDIFYYHIKSFDMEDLKEAVRDAFAKVA